MRRQRGPDSTCEEASRAAGIKQPTYVRVEIGEVEPSYDTAFKIAAWLGAGWTVERVMEAARTPAPGQP
jgi:DNA-binding XRE family transcriptional regulator